MIKTDLPIVEAVRASLIFSSHPGDGRTHHLLCIGDFRQQGGHGEVETQSLRLIRIREVIRNIINTIWSQTAQPTPEYHYGIKPPN